MKRICAGGVIAVQLAGCSGIIGPGNAIGWNDAIPPVGNGVGRLVESNQGYKSLGPAAFPVGPDQIEALDAYGAVTIEEEAKFKGRTEAVFTKITANAGLERSTTNLSTSTGWKVLQLKDFSTAVVGKEFAYKCLTAQEFSYEASRAINAGAAVDTTQVAKAFGVASAAVQVDGGLGNQTKVTIANPNVCLSFISAKLVRDRSWWSKSDSWIPFFRGKDKKFELVIDKPGAKASPDFGSRAVNTKPAYQLAAGSLNGQAILKVLIDNHENDQDIPPKILKETYPGVWSRTFPVHTYHIEDDIYAVMSVDVIAKRTDQNTIEVESASLSSPEYRLIRN
jgi:hypothetical protein